MERKGHNKVIEALPIVLEKIPEARYVIVGDGPERKRLEEKVRDLNLENKVIFAGRVGNSELPAFYQLSDIFVTVSRQIGGDVEGFGTVYLEANQYGKPVVAGRSGGASEAVIEGFNGLLVDPGSPEDIAGAMIKLLTDNELALKLGKQGKERVEREFLWETDAKKLEELLS
ncbi:hypothetical protein A2316_03365 [Candidatus Falkowbacteria bacterium RIFOXYB2_FULL_38_15]|nr:MAG: hypothetical protein A2316_03365 [Candidatus Falkowbacteria bacterium RIFOXYB2_FULL_38_15]